MKWSIRPAVYFDTGIIRMDTVLHGEIMDKKMEEVSTQLIQTKDKAVRECLIKLGWTPPPEIPISKSDS